MSSTSNFLIRELPSFAPSETSLIASIQLTALDGGHFIVPNATRYVALEIGCSDRETMDELWLPKHADGFLVSFEPALDKYAVLLARGTEREHKRTRDRSVRLGAHHACGTVPNFLSHPHPPCKCGTAPNFRTPPSHAELVPPHLPIRFLKIDAQVCM